MTAANLPARPGEMISPNDPTVAFRMSSCQKCPEHSEWIRDDHQERGELYVWNDDHRKATGHRDFFMWTLARNTARIIGG